MFTISSPLVTVRDERSADFDTDEVYGGLYMAPPSSATRAKRRVKFAEPG